MWLFLAFLCVPLIEIALFIQVGGALGLWPTLLIVILTAMIGTYLVRQQGMQALSDLQGSFERASNPAEPLAHGAMILFSGALLLTPGFFTDAVGFALLVPGIRRAVMGYIRDRVQIQTQTFHAQSSRPPHQDGSIVEGEFEEIDPERPNLKGPSGWTKH